MSFWLLVCFACSGTWMWRGISRPPSRSAGNTCHGNGVGYVIQVLAAQRQLVQADEFAARYRALTGMELAEVR